MEERFGRKGWSRRAPHFTLLCNELGWHKDGTMNENVILLVEDNPDDEALTLRALKKNNIVNQVIVARDGAEALDYLFCTGEYSGRDAERLPQVVLLDLKLPKIDGLEVLRRLRGDKRTKLLPVV